ncbi:MAG TPA: MarR family winged helix-turn-helix transcriptional regulator [Candidatus Thermoplasmatota archaeon]|nr:MarR family winged helix-turn-helix transcriptional regulator [Candidatus Thermoplasmatota archaeon]
MPDPRPAAALFLEAIPNVMCQLRNHLADSNSGLTVAQFRCLKMVQRRADVSLGELADANGVSAPAMSKLVDGLVGAGLLERRASTGDRRRVELTVTGVGKRKLDTVGDRLKTRLAAQLSSLGADELAALERALLRLNKVLAEPAMVA